MAWLRRHVRAAGGVIVRDGHVVLVHRPKYDDWALPKGKLEEGESWEDAALREVWEETRIRGALREELSPVEYTDPKGRPKTVRYWRMEALEEGDFTPNSEIDDLLWLTPDEALERLTYDHDRELVLMATRLAAEDG
jgi:8-oxo-dGTP pyrophosphatase MutT (NUDIX family)